MENYYRKSEEAMSMVLSTPCASVEVETGCHVPAIQISSMFLPLNLVLKRYQSSHRALKEISIDSGQRV